MVENTCHREKYQQGRLGAIVSHWNKQQDTGWARVNMNILGKENQQGAQSNPGLRP